VLTLVSEGYTAFPLSTIPGEGHLGVTVVSRLRKDAAFWTLPAAPRPGSRGRRGIYGERQVYLAKRGRQRRGWATGTFAL
jgi:hypothetical protein